MQPDAGVKAAGCLASPTRMQPCVSSGLLPAWMRMPSKSGTPCTSGSHFLNLGDFEITTGYEASRYRRMPRYLAGPSCPIPCCSRPSSSFRFQFDTQEVSPAVAVPGYHRSNAPCPTSPYRSYVQRYACRLFFTPNARYVSRPIAQDIKMTYRISLLFRYSFYYYFHTLIHISHSFEFGS